MTRTKGEAIPKKTKEKAEKKLSPNISSHCKISFFFQKTVTL